MGQKDHEIFSFNINAELYENDRGDLAVRLEDEKVYRVAEGRGSHFVDDAQKVIRDGEMPEGWEEMSPRELAYGPGWHLVGSMGYINGELERPAIELEVSSDKMGVSAKRYLGELAQ